VRHLRKREGSAWLRWPDREVTELGRRIGYFRSRRETECRKYQVLHEDVYGERIWGSGGSWGEDRYVAAAGSRSEYKRSYPGNINGCLEVGVKIIACLPFAYTFRDQ